MPKFYGAIGYGLSVKTAPGVWVPQIKERNHWGDVLKSTKRWQEGESTNDDLIISNKISIVGDEFANSNFSVMRYVKWRGTRWKVTSVDVQPPRLILTLGGVYNGPKPDDASANAGGYSGE